jgi:myo-inositol-1(or 4)-monophosphatase
MTNEDISIGLLKEMARDVYSNVKDLIGTEEGSAKIEKGAGGDISMKIDIIAENTVKDFLIKNQINITLISEESGKEYIGDESQKKGNENRLIVDPIDGSNNSSRGIPFYSVSIAFAKGYNFSSVQNAVILDLNTGDVFWAVKGEGAYLNDKRIYVSEKGLSDQLIFEVDFYIWNLRKKLKKYSSILRKLYRIRVMGSAALSLCLLA